MHDRWRVDYPLLLARAPSLDQSARVEFLLEELPWEWRDRYAAAVPKGAAICRISVETFEYIYDDQSSIECADHESRIVAVIGRSAPTATPRPASRMKGWVGPSGVYLGARTDKGHLAAHSIGGGVDINIVAQDSRLNRGWSPEGRTYRSMEEYGRTHPGTLCFSRPIYGDATARPALLEFGLLRGDGELWVERFEN